MRETLESALVFLEKAAAVVAIVVPAVRGVASIASVNLTETKQFLSNVGAHGGKSHVPIFYRFSFPNTSVNTLYAEMKLCIV